MTEPGTSRAVGIGRIFCLLPPDRMGVAELPELSTLPSEEAAFARDCGIDTVGVFADELPTTLAARACRQLGEAADVLILVGSRAPDVLLGSDATRVQQAADAGVAFTLDGLGCAGSSAAWGLAADMLAAQPGRQQVLIAHGSRPAGPDRVRYPVTVIGDGGYAMTMVRGGRPVLRAHRMETDGAFHDLFTVDYKQAPWYEWREECQSPDRYRFELAMHSKLRLSRLVEEVLADAGATGADVRAALMQNVTASAYDFYQTLLGWPIHPVCRQSLAEYGHLGAMDVVLNLSRLLDSGDVGSGDLVLVLNNSPVAAWTATLWEV